MTRQERKQADIEIVARAAYELMRSLDETDEDGRVLPPWEQLPDRGDDDPPLPNCRMHWWAEAHLPVETLWRAGRLV